MPLDAGAKFAGYTLIRLLGSGGMGEVYLVEHPRLPRRDALKILPAEMSTDPEFRARFNREADLAAELWHPNIVGVRDRGEFEGQLWIAMDYVEGTDAARLLAERYPAGMPQSEVVEIVAAVAEALDYAHEHDLLHRDVKPSNVLLADPGPSRRRRILLADFGIARQTNDDSGLTATNMTVGSVLYAAPEQLTGDVLDGRADQYALAATAYHLFTGQPPFSHSNPAVVIGRHLNTTAPKLADNRSDLAAFDPVMSSALAKDAASRFPTCQDFATALTQRLSETTGLADTQAAIPLPPTPATSPPPSPEPSSDGKKPKRRLIVWAATMAAVVLAGAGTAAVISHHQHPAQESAPAPLAVLDGMYRLVYDGAKQTANGAPFKVDPSIIADNTRWWAFRSLCRGDECVAAATQLDKANPQIAHNPPVTATLRFVAGQWREETPRRHRQDVAKCLGVDQKVVAGNEALVDAFSMEPQVNGTLRGVATSTVVSNECGGEGIVAQTPFVATRTGDTPAGVVVADPASISAPSATPPVTPPPGPTLDGTYRVDYDDTAQTVNGAPTAGSSTTETSFWAFRSTCTPTQCIATGAGLEDNNPQAPSGAADVLQCGDGHWTDTPSLFISKPCTPGTGTTNDLLSWSMDPQTDGTLSGVQTDTVIDGDCGPQSAATGKVYKTPFRMTRTGDVPPSVVLADPRLFLS